MQLNKFCIFVSNYLDIVCDYSSMETVKIFIYFKLCTRIFCLLHLHEFNRDTERNILLE